MKQTKTYNLNLIEMSDTFSPAPLNENMEALETALSSGLADEAAARQSADNSLRSRISTLETHRIAIGTYTGNGASAITSGPTISLGFTPKAVFVQHGNSSTLYMAVSGGSTMFLKILSGGFQTNNTALNTNNVTYSYLALS